MITICQMKMELHVDVFANLMLYYNYFETVALKCYILPFKSVLFSLLISFY